MEPTKPPRLVRMVQLLCTGCGQEWWAPIHHPCLDCGDPNIPVLFGSTITEMVYDEVEEVKEREVRKLPPSIKIEDLLIRSVSKGREKPCRPLSQEELSDLHCQFPWW